MSLWKITLNNGNVSFEEEWTVKYSFIFVYLQNLSLSNLLWLHNTDGLTVCLNERDMVLFNQFVGFIFHLFFVSPQMLFQHQELSSSNSQ